MQTPIGPVPSTHDVNGRLADGVGGVLNGGHVGMVGNGIDGDVHHGGGRGGVGGGGAGVGAIGGAGDVNGHDDSMNEGDGLAGLQRNLEYVKADCARLNDRLSDMNGRVCQVREEVQHMKTVYRTLADQVDDGRKMATEASCNLTKWHKYRQDLRHQYEMLSAARASAVPDDEADMDEDGVVDDDAQGDEARACGTKGDHAVSELAHAEGVGNRMDEVVAAG